MTDVNNLANQLNERFSDWIVQSKIALGELTVEVKADHLLDLCHALNTTPEFDFNMLIDICGVDYLAYGFDDWQTESTTFTGFSRGVTQKLLHPDAAPFEEPTDSNTSRFAVVYHLLSLTHNFRVRLRVRIPQAKEIIVDSVVGIWPAANWYEREAFDLFGILFKGHPDLRRLLTDYGFVGHPFRKDFPLIGRVEARYDAALRRVIYDPVSITPRVLEPKVIRHDNRYQVMEENNNGK